MLAAALGIHTVEARHAAWMRYLNGITPAAAAFDDPRPKKEIDRIVRATGFVSRPAEDGCEARSRVHGVRAWQVVAAGGGRGRRSPRRWSARSVGLPATGAAAGGAALGAGDPGAAAARARAAPVDLGAAAPDGRRACARLRGARRWSRALPVRTPEGTPHPLPVLGRRSDDRGRVWVRVGLPVLPNGTAGWVPRRALGAYELERHRLVVDLERLRATLLRRGRPVFERRDRGRDGPLADAARRGSSSATGWSATTARSTVRSRSARARARRR